MDWNNSLIEGLQWSDIIINKEGKERVAKELALRVKENEVIGRVQVPRCILLFLR